MPKNEVSIDQVLDWLGSEATIDECAEIIQAVANGQYKPSLLRSEINDYSNE
jgi:hypothetical protein